jgi:hypothetical protein
VITGAGASAIVVDVATVALAEPAELVAVTLSCRMCPTSAGTSW